MASPKHIVKPLAEWNMYDLEAFNIEVTTEHDTTTFLGVGVSDLPVPQNVSSVIWNNVHAPPGPLSKTEKTFFAYMEDAMLPLSDEWSLVDDFALFLLELFDYDGGPNRVLYSHEELWLADGGSKVRAKIEGAVVERIGCQSYYVFLVQEKRSLNHGILEPEAQLVARAIAAFNWNNRARDLIGLPALDSQTFPAIIMYRTFPEFYLVTITNALSVAVQAGTYPQDTTVVRKFELPVQSIASSMFSLQHRKVLFGLFESFKQYLLPPIEGVKTLIECPKAWEPTKGSCDLVVNRSDPCCDALVEAGNIDETVIQWTANIAPGTKVRLSVVDKDDQESWSSVVPISNSSDALRLFFTGPTSAVATLTAAGFTCFPPLSLNPYKLAFDPETLWTIRDLRAFDIEITAEHDIQTFFGVAEYLPSPQNISPEIWDNVRAPTGALSKTEKMFFAFMEDALPTPTNDLPHAVNFVRFLLRFFDYDNGPNRVLHSHKDIWFFRAGSKAYVKTDVAVIERLGNDLYYNLLIQEDRHHYDGGWCDPEAQLVVQAIAAFTRNRWTLRKRSRPVLDSQTFPGIIMTCTTPTFYLITVTHALSMAVDAGRRPQETTIVRKFVPPVELTAADSMLSLQNRRTLFGYFEAFKQSLPPAIEKKQSRPFYFT